MAKTGYLPGDDEAQEAWYKDLYEETDRMTLLAPLEGGEFSVIHRKNDLQAGSNMSKGKGGIVHFGLLEKLNKGFLSSGQSIEGNEQKFNTIMNSIQVEEKKMGIRDDGELSRQVTFFDMDSTGRRALAKQIAENTDYEYIKALQATGDTTLVYTEHAGTPKLKSTIALAKANLTASDKVSPEFLTNLKNLAMSYRNSGFSPIRPVDVGNGEMMLIFLTTHDALADMENDANFIQAQQNALNRAKDNPLFKGAYAVWRNVIIFATDNGLEVGSDAGTGGDVPYVRSHLLGAQALCSAWAKDGELRDAYFDYGTEHGIGYISIWETQKSKFATNGGSNMQYGSIDVITARTQLTDLTIDG